MTESIDLQKLTDCLPRPPLFEYDRDGLMSSPLGGLLAGLADTPQDGEWHGEGDVLKHTWLVCDSLSRMPEYRALDRSRGCALALAALLHDIGKINTTRVDDGRITSRGHSLCGAKMAREILWRDFNLCGSADAQAFRETVCLLIKYHMRPAHMLDAIDPALDARKIAANGELYSCFSLDMLFMLAKADIRGRVSDDAGDMLDSVELARQLAFESGCLCAPYPFPGEHTQRAYLAGKNVWQDQPLYDGAWGEATLMCGLPGTGKDTWIRQNRPDLPTVCLDGIRREMHISPDGEQGAVVQAAKEAARTYLRAKRPFIWNATCLSEKNRRALISLCEQYGSYVRIVYLETEWLENLRRNSNRQYSVPVKVMARMLRSFEPPERYESRIIDNVFV